MELIFLDIDMPQMSGLAFANLVPKPVQIVFTTAHAEFAAESYEVEAFDYLLKPISLGCLTTCILCIQSKKIDRSDEGDRIDIRSGSRTYFLKYGDIGYLEKDGHYMVYHLDGHKILSSERIQEALLKLAGIFYSHSPIIYG